MAEPVQQWPPHYREAWTEADLDAMPDDGNKYEILDGRLIVTPPPTNRHQRATFTIARALHEAAPRGWAVRPGVGVRLQNGNVEPDITVLRHEVDDAIWNDAANVALVVEVASPSTKTYDAGDKAVAYACAGIPWYWRVVPGKDGAIHIHALTGIAEYSLHAKVSVGETRTLTEPFPITVVASDWLEPDD
jgi:Uma2 family endonuclease